MKVKRAEKAKAKIKNAIDFEAPTVALVSCWCKAASIDDVKSKKPES